MAWVKRIDTSYTKATSPGNGGDDGSTPWNGITSSSDGNYIYAIDNQTIFISRDGGSSWVFPSGNGSSSWISISTTTTTVVNKIGKYSISGIDGSLPAISSNYADTWTFLDNTLGTGNTTGISGSSWPAVATSYNGTSGQYVACNNGGYIYTSSDGAVNWTDTQSSTGNPGTDNWISVSISETASSTIVAVSGTASGGSGQMVVGTLSGSYSWQQLSSRQNWSCVAISGDGTVIVGAVTGGAIYIITYSSSWGTLSQITCTGLPTTQNWTSISTSSDGKKIIAGSGSSLTGTNHDSAVYILDSSTAGGTYTYFQATVATSPSFSPAYDIFVTMSATAPSANDYKMALADATPPTNPPSGSVGFIPGGSIYTSTNSGVSCFAKGTMISIRDGNVEKEIQIENLKAYHLIKISNGDFVPIKSVIYNFTSHANALKIIKKIPKNRFGENKPYQDLYISKDHGLLFDSDNFDKHKNQKYMNKEYEIYIDGFKKLCAEHINGNYRIFKNELAKITNDDGRVYYYHIILDDTNEKHGIYANGVLSESFKLSKLKKRDFNEIESFRK